MRGSKRLAEVKAVHARQHEIEKDKAPDACLTLLLPEIPAGFQTVRTRRREADAVAFCLEPALEKIGDTCVVFNDQDVHQAASSSSMGSDRRTVVPLPTVLSRERAPP